MQKKVHSCDAEKKYSQNSFGHTSSNYANYTFKVVKIFFKGQTKSEVVLCFGWLGLKHNSSFITVYVPFNWPLHVPLLSHPQPFLNQKTLKKILFHYRLLVIMVTSWVLLFWQQQAFLLDWAMLLSTTQSAPEVLWAQAVWWFTFKSCQWQAGPIGNG